VPGTITGTFFSEKWNKAKIANKNEQIGVNVCCPHFQSWIFGWKPYISALRLAKNYGS
jgi:hypothetical protein